MRDLTDKYRISREKLAYIADSTSAPLIVLMPFSGWAAYLTGIAAGVAAVGDKQEAMTLFIRAIPYNFYAFLAVFMVLFVSIGLVPEFGPMKKAERRALETGLVVREGAVLMMGRERGYFGISCCP